MKNIAFVYTEYQQNILFAICLQRRIKIDILFVRKNINLHKNAKSFVDRVIYFDDIAFSWRSILRYIDEYKRVISPELEKEREYLVCSWSIEHPIVRLTLEHLKSPKLYLFEDGSGSYLKRGYFGFYLGIKAFLSTALIDTVIDVYSLSLLPFNKKRFVGWSLYEHCFPDLKIDKKIIGSQCFQKAMIEGIDLQDPISLEKNSIVFIQQPYVEMTVMSEKEYMSIITQVLEKIKKYTTKNNVRVIWKLHPRTNRDQESKRLKKIRTDLNIELVQEQWNIEYIAYMNRDKNIQYFSLGSSALYVIYKLVPEPKSIFLIKNDRLMKKLPTQAQLNTLYGDIGIHLI